MKKIIMYGEQERRMNKMDGLNDSLILILLSAIYQMLRSF
jgi:hypothetical protein